MADDKGPGQGRGKFTKAGVQADQEARIAAIETFLAEQFPDDTGTTDTTSTPTA